MAAGETTPEHTVLKALAESSDATLSSALQKHLLDVALRDKDQVLMAALASRRDLDASAERELISTGSARVLQTWLTDPARTVEALADAAKDPRPSVREVVAARPNLPAAIYADCAVNPSWGVVEALAGNHCVPSGLAGKAAADAAVAHPSGAAKRFPPRYGTVEPALDRAVVEAPPEAQQLLLDTLFDSQEPGGQLRRLVATFGSLDGITAEQHRRLVSLYIQHPPDFSDVHWLLRSRHATEETWRNLDLRLREVGAAFTHRDGRSTTTTPLPSWIPAAVRSRDLAPFPASRPADKVPTGDETELASLLRTCPADELVSHIVAAHSDGHRAALAAVVDRDDLTDEAISALLPARTPVPAPVERAIRGRVEWSNDPQTDVKLLLLTSRATLGPVLEKYGQPAAEVASEALLSGQVAEAFSRERAACELARYGFLLLVPAPLFQHVGEQCPMELAESLAGCSRSQLDLVFNLLDGFDGTVGELVETAKRLTEAA